MIGTAGLLLAGCSLPFGPKSIQSGPQGALDQAANATKLSVMMATGKAGTCTITNTVETTATATEISVKGKKFRMKGSDFGGVDQPTAETTPAVAKMGYMLNDGEYLYFLQDQATTGMKMKVEPSVTPAKTGDDANTMYTEDSQNPADQFEADAKYRIDCKLGNVSDDLLTPPTEVKFLDLSQALTFPGADKVPAYPSMPDLPTDLPTDLNDSGE
jgi:hypothetical protein